MFVGPSPNFDLESPVMGRVGFLAMLAVVLFGVVAPSAIGSATVPTVGLCERAWNAPVNSANRLRLIALAPVVASLRPGSTFTDTWKKGGKTSSTQSDACLLMLTQPGGERVVTGVWSKGVVLRWKFGPVIKSSFPTPPPNVRIRADGRLSLA